MGFGGRQLSWLVAGSLVATTVLAATPGGVVADEPGLHLIVETAAGLVAIAVGALLLGRFALTRRRLELAVAAGMMIVGLSHVGFSALVTAVHGGPHPAGVTAAMLAQFVAGLVGVAGAVAPERVVRRLSARHAILACLGCIAAVAAAVALAAPATLPSRGSGTGLHAFAIIVFSAWALHLWRRSAREHDPFMRTLAVAAALAAVARLNFLLHPTLHSAEIGPGDGFRLLVHLVLLAAAAGEVQRYWRGVAAAAVADERRRIARDLHDGIAQELAHITRHGDEVVRDAAERALRDVRAAVGVLRAHDDAPLHVLLAAAVAATARRAGVVAHVRAPAGVDLCREDREEVVRIACEAVANAARHGGARRIDVHLGDGHGLTLRVEDDGSGFGRARRTGGFGVEGMRERAARLGGELRLGTSAAGGGAVELVLP